MAALPGVLRIREFRDLWIAQTVSILGDSIYFLVFLFMAGKVSSDNFQVGLVMTASAAPFLLLSPYAGVIADRLDRRKIMAFADFASAALTLGLAGFAWFEPLPSNWVIGSFAFALSCVNAFFMPARMAALPRLVPESVLAEANGVFMTTQQIVWMIGMALSASVLAYIEKMLPNSFLFAAALFNSATFLFSSYWVLRLPKILPQMSEQGEEPKRGWVEFKQGLRVVLGDPVMRIALPVNVLSQMFISGFLIAYLAVNKAWFGDRFGTLALIELSFAVSMAAFGLVVGRLNIRRPGFAFLFATGIVGLTVLAMGWARELWLFVFWNVAAGIVIPFAWIPIQTYIQAGFADSVRGRVSSAWVGTQMSVQPIGLLGIGPLIDWLGLTGAFVVIGGGMALASFAGLGSKACRDVEMPTAQAV